MLVFRRRRNVNLRSLQMVPAVHHSGFASACKQGDDRSGKMNSQIRSRANQNQGVSLIVHQILPCPQSSSLRDGWPRCDVSPQVYPIVISRASMVPSYRRQFSSFMDVGNEIAYGATTREIFTHFRVCLNKKVVIK